MKAKKTPKNLPPRKPSHHQQWTPRCPDCGHRRFSVTPYVTSELLYEYHDNGDVTVPCDRRMTEWRRRDERIILGRDDQGRDPNLIDDAQGAGAIVVIGRIAEPVVRRRIHIVEAANRHDAPQCRQ